MQRRVLGVIVLALTMLAALVVPGLQGRRIAGEGVRGPEPLVGDCVLATSPQPDLSSESVRSDRPTAEPTDCSAAGAARVISRFARVEVPDAGPGRSFVPFAAMCQGGVRALLEQWQGGAYTFRWDGGLINMGPAVRFAGVPATPGAAAAERDERWLVCAAVGTDGTGASVPDPMLQDGPDSRWTQCGTGDPAILAVRGPASTSTLVPCDTPHRWQLIGSSTGGRYDSAFEGPDLAAMCSDYIRSVTGMTDPTAEGALRVRVVADHPMTARCVVDAQDSRTLSGSLLGLGDGPVPWT